MPEVAMRTLLANFSLFAEAPNGLKNLRQLIITLGVEGRLTDSESSKWMLSTLGECVEIVRGITFPASAKRHAPEPGLIPCLRTANVQNEITWADLLYVSSDYVRSSNQLVRVNDLLISMANSRDLVGKVALVRRDDIECTLGGFIAALRVNDQLLPKYLMNVLRVPTSRDRLIDSATQTTNIANISMGRLKPFELRLPPLAEQELIVDKIDELMALCDQLEEAQNNRDSIRTAARKSAIDAVATASTSQELEVAWNRISSNWDVMADTPESVGDLRRLIVSMFTRPLPGSRGKWVNRSLSSLVQILNGDRSSNYPSKEKRVRMGIPFINAGHLKSGQVNMENMDYITIERFNLLNGGKIEQGDVLFCLRGSLGKCALVETSAPGTIASSLAILRPNQEILPRYLLRFLQSDSCKRQIKQHDNGSAQPNLAAKSILKFELELPSLPEQEMIVAEIDSLMALCDQLEEHLVSRNAIAKKFARSVTVSESL